MTTITTINITNKTTHIVSKRMNASLNNLAKQSKLFPCCLLKEKKNLSNYNITKCKN